jgi:hypothetical protein
LTCFSIDWEIGSVVNRQLRDDLLNLCGLVMVEVLVVMVVVVINRAKILSIDKW